MAVDLRNLLGPNSTERTLYRQRPEVGSGSADFGVFSFRHSRSRCSVEKHGPGTKILRDEELRHTHSDFGKDVDSGKRLDTWRRHNMIELRKVVPDGRQNQEFQVEPILYSLRLSM